VSINRTNKESNALDKERSILYNSFMNAPAGIAILKGDTHIFEYANAFYENLIGRTVTKGKTIHEILPEIEKQGLSHILDTVFTTGKPYIHNALPVDLEKKEKGITERYYLNLVVQPLNDSDGNPEKLFVQIIDVTEQVEVRKQIEESELKFKHLTEVIPHMVWTAKPDGKRDYFNKYILDFTGRTFEELCGDGWQKMISPLDLERTLNCWNHCIHTGEPFKIENRWRHHNGSEYWFLTQAIAQKDKDGKILRWIGTNTNITEQKEFARVLEKKVKKRTYQLYIQNETFKHAEESSKKGSYSFNLTTAKLSYSDNLYRILGYEPNEFKPSLEEFNKHVHPEDKENVASEGQKVLHSKTAEEWQYRMITKTGKVIYIKGTGKVIESNDQLLLVGSLQDVTKDYELNKELQEKEDYLNQVINNAPDAIIVINEKNIINLWNPKTEEIFGWKADEVIGTP
jgi:PAS domain S-box-containing protein